MNRLLKQKLVRVSTHETDLLYRDFFNTPNGEKVLEDLTLHFCPETLIGDTEFETVVKAVKSEFMRYIQRRIKDGMDGKSIR